MSITFACSLFGVSRQVYYRSKSRVIKYQDRAEQVVALVSSVRRLMPRIGGKKLYHILEVDLRKLGVGRDKLFSILRANKLLIKAKRQYHITTNSHHRFRKHKNLIDQLTVSRPEQVWVSDITYVGNRTDPKYLALVTDSYSKKIVGFDVSNSLSTASSLRALSMGIAQRQYKDQKLIHHSDRGLQYCSDAYQSLLVSNKIICSMTESYDPYQNATAERVNGILKQEFLLGLKIKDIDLMKELVEQSIAIYNNYRPHLSCHLYTPAYMHSQSEITIKTYKTKQVKSLNPLPV